MAGDSKLATEQRVVHYSGEVQGVGFRYTACRIAEQHAVAGYVKNLSDGRVELAAEGAAAGLDRFLGAVRQRLASHIQDVQVDVRPATGEFRGFEIRS